MKDPIHRIKRYTVQYKAGDKMIYDFIVDNKTMVAIPTFGWLGVNQAGEKFLADAC